MASFGKAVVNLDINISKRCSASLQWWIFGFPIWTRWVLFSCMLLSDSCAEEGAFQPGWALSWRWKLLLCILETDVSRHHHCPESRYAICVCRSFKTSGIRCMIGWEAATHEMRWREKGAKELWGIFVVFSWDLLLSSWHECCVCNVRKPEGKKTIPRRVAKWEDDIKVGPGIWTEFESCYIPVACSYLFLVLIHFGVSSSHCMPSKGTIVVNNDLEEIWKEAFLPHFETICHHMPGWTEGNHENLQSL